MASRILQRCISVNVPFLCLNPWERYLTSQGKRNSHRRRPVLKPLKETHMLIQCSILYPYVTTFKNLLSSPFWAWSLELPQAPAWFFSSSYSECCEALSLPQFAVLIRWAAFLAWLPQYRLTHLQGDLVAAITMASFYIPMALSLASNLAHVPAINGLYSFVFNPVRPFP